MRISSHNSNKTTKVYWTGIREKSNTKRKLQNDDPFFLFDQSGRNDAAGLCELAAEVIKAYQETLGVAEGGMKINALT